MFNLLGKTALVTGSSRGIGKGIALCLAEAGADVIINYNGSENEAKNVADEIRKIGRKATVIHADVSDEEQVKLMFNQIEKLDILVNNAGTSQDKDIFETDKDDWDSIIKINLTSGFLCTKFAMEIMRKQNYGRIIFISSVVGERGALFGHVHYAATKSGQIGMTKTVARTGAPYNITVNAIAPGIIETELLFKTHGEDGVAELWKSIPLDLGKLNDIGAAAAYLASDEGITGIGEGTLEYKENALCGAIEDLKRYLIGKSPLDIEAHYYNMYRDAYWRGGAVLMSAISAIEIALWDINAKSLNVPVYRLLGGKINDKVKIYVNGWFAGAKEPEEFAQKAKETVKKGIKAMKWDPFGNSYMNISNAMLNKALENIGAVRDAVGNDIDLLIEGHGRFDVPMGIKIAKELE